LAGLTHAPLQQSLVFKQAGTHDPPPEPPPELAVPELLPPVPELPVPDPLAPELPAPEPLPLAPELPVLELLPPVLDPLPPEPPWPELLPPDALPLDDEPPELLVPEPDPPEPPPRPSLDGESTLGPSTDASIPGPGPKAAPPQSAAAATRPTNPSGTREIKRTNHLASYDCGPIRRHGAVYLKKAESVRCGHVGRWASAG
jgi:hypothetical protein